MATKNWLPKSREFYSPRKEKKESTFPLPKPYIKTLIHAAISKHFDKADVGHLLVLTFSEGGEDDVRDDAGKQCRFVNNIKDYGKEVHKKIHGGDKDVMSK